MLYQYIRLLRDTAGTISDLSLSNQNEGETIDLEVVSPDYLYLGQLFPFNNFLIQSNDANALAGNLELQYWAGATSGWKDAIDVLDGSFSATSVYNRSGVVHFTPNPDFGWNRVPDTSLESNLGNMTGARLFNLYWVRFRASAAPTNPTTAKRISYAFTQSQQLDNLDSEINKFLAAFATGKTDWNDEIMTASIQVVQDLKRMGWIDDRGEVIKADEISMATDYKTLTLIYKNLGPAFAKKLEQAEKDYLTALPKKLSKDINRDAALDLGEMGIKTSRLIR